MVDFTVLLLTLIRQLVNGDGDKDEFDCFNDHEYENYQADDIPKLFENVQARLQESLGKLSVSRCLN